MTQLKSSLLYRIVIFSILLLLVVAAWNVVSTSSRPPQDLMGVLRIEPKQLSSFQLSDQKGRLVDKKMFKNKWSFVFFGYTSCPDICPITLHVLNKVITILGDKDAKNLLDAQVVFVSVDPKRDTVDSLSDYVTFFNKDFIGLTGDKKSIDNFTQQFGSGYMMGQEISPGEYLVSHTSAIFLVSPDNKMVASFSQPHNPETIASQYEAIRDYLLK